MSSRRPHTISAARRDSGAVVQVRAMSSVTRAQSLDAALRATCTKQPPPIEPRRPERRHEDAAPAQRTCSRLVHRHRWPTNPPNLELRRSQSPKQIRRELRAMRASLRSDRGELLHGPGIRPPARDALHTTARPRCSVAQSRWLAN